MSSVPDDVRLLLFLSVNALILSSAVRFVRRLGIVDRIQTALDAMLLWYLVQYLAVALPGVFGMLNAASATLVAIACSAAMLSKKRIASTLASNRADESLAASDRLFIRGALAIVIALIGANIFVLRFAPPLANDALTYHLPAAAQWIQTGKLGLYQTWFFNPANTYSPLAGSTFAAWMMLFTGNDVLARFDQAPALLMLFLAALQLARALGTDVKTAALLALATACARPFISQVLLAKDDLFVAAFFTCALASLAPSRSSDRFGGWRFGIAIGLFFAMKYTTLLAAPVFVLALDAPHRARWRGRQFAIALGTAILIAGPWYARNVWLTGNPLFPMGSLFTTARAQQLIGASNGWHTITASYNAPPLALFIALLVGWAQAIAFARKRITADPIARVCLIGPPIAIALFVFLSPFAEVRFINPAIILLFASVALIARPASRALATALACISLATSFKIEPLLALALPAIVGLVFIAITFAWIAYRTRVPRLRKGVELIALLVFVGGLYVGWPAYILGCRLSAERVWHDVYGDLSDAWDFARDHVPPGDTIAYANTYYTFPLMGYDLDHRVAYAPVRREVRTIAHLGRVGRALAGEEIVDRIVEETNCNADRDAWIEHLRATHAKFLFVEKKGNDVPELRFAAMELKRFRVVFDNSAARIFEIDGDRR